MSNMSDGGKGSSPRPFGVDSKTFDDNFKNIFGESKLEKRIREEAEAKAKLQENSNTK